MRIAIGVMAHEANSFCPHTTELADFEAYQLRRGEQVLAGWRSVSTEESGAMGILESESQVVPLMTARAMSGGPVRGDDYRALRDELVARLRAALPVDGVLLVLHGAMAAESVPDATGDILEHVRALVGASVPVVGTLDLHANVTERMVRNATALVGYQTAPHVDQLQVGQRAARILLSAVRGESRPCMALVRLPMLLPPENSTHQWGPLAEVIAMIVQLEQRQAILHGAAFPMQPWMDLADVASSILLVADGNPEATHRHAMRLAQAFWERRAQFACPLISPSDAIAQALARQSGTVILCDSADSTTSGSTGDSTAILQAALAALPFDLPALLNVVDAPAVAQAIATGVGSTVRLTVGGRLAPGMFVPLTFEGYVKTISDGVFRFTGPGFRGVPHSMGRAVVLVQGGVHLVVMERGVSQWDPALYRSLGLEPREARIVQAKSPMAFRAAYAEITNDVIIVDAPGASSPKLASLPWKHLPRPIYPLDADVGWSPQA